MNPIHPLSPSLIAPKQTVSLYETSKEGYYNVFLCAIMCSCFVSHAFSQIPHVICSRFVVEAVTCVTSGFVFFFLFSLKKQPVNTLFMEKTSWRKLAKASTSQQEELPQTERLKNKIKFIRLLFKQHGRRKDVAIMTQVNKSITFCFHPEEKSHNPRGETNQRALVRLQLKSSDCSGSN